MIRVTSGARISDARASTELISFELAVFLTNSLLFVVLELSVLADAFEFFELIFVELSELFVDSRVVLNADMTSFLDRLRLRLRVGAEFEFRSVTISNKTSALGSALSSTPPTQQYSLKHFLHSSVCAWPRRSCSRRMMAHPTHLFQRRSRDRLFMEATSKPFWITPSFSVLRGWNVHYQRYICSVFGQSMKLHQVIQF